MHDTPIGGFVFPGGEDVFGALLRQHSTIGKICGKVDHAEATTVECWWSQAGSTRPSHGPAVGRRQGNVNEGKV